ncbi:DNA polymerase zeta catalytic subunit like protein [Verticillium longisporum]|nr:DNA polymerase zeta catalytic subunit like protein [Verticillium longisporum]
MEELDLFVRMVEIVRTHDPDILTGYEVHGSSWGYLIERARVKYDYDLCDEFSRMKSNSHGRIGKENDRWGFNTTSTIRVTGRHMINVWRAMRGELNLLQYSMENVVWHLLHRRIPHYSWSTLTKWYKSGMHRDMSKLMRYYLSRTRLDIDIIEANELIPRTSEQARLLGVDFFSVFSRGSQYKVESIMFRIAKPENFILVSPSRQQSRDWLYGQTPLFSFSTRPTEDDPRPRPTLPDDFNLSFEARQGVLQSFVLGSTSTAGEKWSVASLADAKIHDVDDWVERLRGGGINSDRASAIGSWLNGLLGAGGGR